MSDLSLIAPVATADHSYQVGGSLRFGAPSYIRRQADNELYQALLRGEYCYVFNARQMGKSSLRVCVQQRLIDAGKCCASVDMTSIGSERVTPLQWYKGLMVDLLTKLELRGAVDFKQWWQGNAELSLVQRLRLFIEEILLRQLPDKEILIFVDEIDSALALDFPIDDFFALVRFCYNQRAEDPIYRRLTWSLFGVVTPSDLIFDRARTPFNVGRGVELKGLAYEDALPLASGLKGYGYDEALLLKEILAWTNGQPFLTQKLCRLTVQMLQAQALDTLPERVRDRPSDAIAFVEKVVYTRILDHWESQDDPEHLRTIRDRLLRDELQAPRLLGIYESVLNASVPLCDLPVVDNHETAQAQSTEMRQLVYDDSPEHLDLLLSGLLGLYQGKLEIKNRIYETIFDLSWVRTQLSDLRPYARQIDAWISSDQTDESRLLRGKALQDAQAWSQERSVSEIDHEFLMASERYDRRMVQQAMKSARLKEVEKRLEIVRQSRRQQRRLIAALSGALLVAVSLAAMVRHQYLRVQKSQLRALVTSAESLYAADQRLDALVGAIEAHNFVASSARSAPLALRERTQAVLRQTAVSVVEKNQLTLAEGNFWDVAISPSAQHLVTGSSDHAVRLWDKDGNLLHTFLGHRKRVRTVGFLKQGKQIISGSEDRSIKVWAPDGKLIKTLAGHTGSVVDIAKSADEEWIASAGEDGVVKIWRTADWTLLRTFYVDTSELVSIAVSPDGKAIAANGDRGQVGLWSLAGQRLTTLEGQTSTVISLAFSPEGQHLVSGSRDGTVVYWDLATEQLVRTLRAHRSGVASLAFSPNGQQLATASRDRTIKLWNTEGTLITTLEGHNGRLQTVEFDHSGEQLVSAAADKTVRVWDLTNPLLTAYFGPSNSIIDVATSPDGKLVAAASDDRTLYIWDAKTAQLVRRLEHPGAVLSIDWSPTDPLIVTGSWDGTTRLWTLTGELLTAMTNDKPIWDVAFSPDGQRIAAGGGDSQVRVWDQQGNLQALLNRHVNEVRSVAFSPDGQQLLTASLDRTVRLWQLNLTNEQQPTVIQTFRSKVLGDALEASGSGFIDARFSPDGQYVAAGGFDNLARVWSVDGELQATFAGHTAEVRSVDFSSDGQQLVTASGDGQVKLWKRDGELIATLSESGEAVWQASFAGSDSQVLSAGEDHNALLWDLDNVLNAEGLAASGCQWVADYLQSNPGTEEYRDLCADYLPGAS